MDVMLIPGFWLDGSSWGDVGPVLEQAGHQVRALTLPGLESADADRRGIGLRDHVDAVVAAIDEADGPVVLVGHSGGGAIAHAAADARPDRVARVVYVDSWPLGEGRAINDELTSVDGEIPLPDWSESSRASSRASSCGSGWRRASPASPSSRPCATSTTSTCPRATGPSSRGRGTSRRRSWRR
jgi:pimeloyl-ACP methyl ester carboxylesterase